MVPTVEEIEEYLDSLEDFLFSAAPDLLHVREAVHRLWLDVSRFGPQSLPSMSDIHVPGLGTFEVPPPPPPPPPKSWFENSVDWVSLHPWAVGGIVAGVAGASLLAGYSTMHRHARFRRVKTTTTATGERRQVIVVLGGDHPLALPLLTDLEKKGYIVITSVSTLEAIENIEHRCNGYVRALVLDPEEPGTLPIFLRSLVSTLSRKFPINVPGDPHTSPSSHPYIHSVISLLTLPTASIPIPTPLEHLPIQSTYLPYLLATHVTPIRLLQAFLPLLRTSPSRTRDSFFNNFGSKTVIVCVPATDARVGLPFSSAQAMSAAATLRGIEVLRREIKAAALTDTTESMKNIKIVVADIGSVGHSAPQFPQDMCETMAEWTPSEKVAYGPAFSSILEEGNKYGVARRPADVSTFVNALVEVVSGGRMGGGWAFTLSLGLGRVRNWMRGERFAVGAGAHTYAYASYLPSRVLNTLLSIPYFLVSIRNSLLSGLPAVASPSQPPSDPHLPPAPPPAPVAADVAHSPEELSEHEASISETGSEADIESNSSGHDGVGSSWIKA